MSESFSARAGAGDSVESDVSLIALVQQHDGSAMERLFQRHSRLVFAIALRVLHDRSAADDILQEVFMQIWISPTKFVAERGSLPSLLAVMSRNKSIDVLRRRRPSDPVEEVQLESSFNLAELSERHILLERARLVIAELPPEQRNALEMAFFEGLTHTEIAEKSGHPLGTVKTRIRSALQMLGKALNA